MAHPHFFRDHQGRQFRQCSHCEGAGEITVNTSNPYGYGPDPQEDREETCPECSGEGDFRVTPIDPLERLADLRRAMFDPRNGSMRRRFRDLYDQHRAELARPSNVPTRHYDDPMFREAKRDCDAALSASAVFMGALGSLTGYRSAA